MKTCGYCGKEYPDDAVKCLIDGEPLSGGPTAALTPAAEASEPIAASSIPDEPLTDRQLRIFEVILVCLIAIGSSIVVSLSALSGSRYGSSGKGVAYWANAILHEGAGLGLLWYVLLRRGKSFANLGLSWAKTDFGWSLLLWIGGTLSYYVVLAAIYSSGLIVESPSTGKGRAGEWLFKGGVSGMTMLFQFVNPFFEEMIIRAYLMTEVRQLTNSAAKAVILSTLIQTSYHFYQGVPLALADGAGFLLFSIFYARTNRITPIILAHLYIDVIGTLFYAAHHG